MMPLRHWPNSLNAVPLRPKVRVFLLRCVNFYSEGNHTFTAFCSLSRRTRYRSCISDTVGANPLHRIHRSRSRLRRQISLNPSRQTSMVLSHEREAIPDSQRRTVEFHSTTQGFDRVNVRTMLEAARTD